MRSSRVATAIAVGAVLLVAGPLAGPAIASSVGGATLSLSSTSATATQVTYTVAFTATGGLTTGSSTITLTGPAGTAFPTASSCGNGYGVGLGSAPPVQCGAIVTAGGGTNSVTFKSPIDASPGAAVTVVVNGVTNSSATGTQSLAVSTSNDTTPVMLAFSLTAPTSMSAVQFHQTSTSATATQVTYKLSATLTNGLTAAFSTFTFAAPAGAAFPSSDSCGGDYNVSVNGAAFVSCSAHVLSGAGTNVVTFNSSVSAKAGDKVVVTVDGVANPTTSGSKAINLSTSSDPVAVGEPMNLTAPTSISGLSAVASTTTPSATGATYTLSFTATNGLTAKFSTVSVTGPSGTVFSGSQSCGGDYAMSVNGAPLVTCGAVVVSGGGTNAVVFNSSVDAVGGDHITVTITHVSNSSASGTQQLMVSTSSDPGPVSAPLTLAGSAPPPTAANDNYATPENTALNVPAAGVLTNDTGPSGHTLTAAIVAMPTHGTATLQPNGAFSYTPSTGFAGSDSFTYKATDTTSSLTSNTATVTIAVDATPPVVTVPPPPPNPVPTPVPVTPPPVKFCYSADDQQSGIAGYDVRYREADWQHAFRNFVYPPGWQHTMQTCESLTGKPGHEYCFSMRAHNHAGEASAWSHQWCRALIVDDRQLTATASWSRATGSQYYLHTVTTASKKGSVIELTGAHVHRVGLLVTRCPSCGKVVVVIGHQHFTVDTHTGHTTDRVLMMLPVVHTQVTTITITTSSNKPVFIDGLAVLPA